MLTIGQSYYRRNKFISAYTPAIMIIFVLCYYPKFLSQEIPQTIKTFPSKIGKPDTSHIFVQDTLKAYKLPDDVRKNLRGIDKNPNIDSKSNNKKISTGTRIEKKNNTVRSAAPAQQNLSPAESMPRLIYEKVPAEGENKFNGELQLSLKINEDGQVVDHRILSNSLNCTECLNEIVQAAYSSKWEPAIVDGKKIVYWVVKSYAFN